LGLSSRASSATFAIPSPSMGMVKLGEGQQITRVLAPTLFEATRTHREQSTRYERVMSAAAGGASAHELRGTSTVDAACTENGLKSFRLERAFRPRERRRSCAPRRYKRDGGTEIPATSRRSA